MDISVLVSKAFSGASTVVEDITVEHIPLRVKLQANSKKELDGKFFYQNTEIVSFYCDNEKKELCVECIKVPERFRRKGIGTLAFQLLYEITAEVNRFYVQQGDFPLLKMVGELSSADGDLGEFSLSVPFYRKQAELLHLSLKMYEKDDYGMLISELMSDADFTRFIEKGYYGSFEYELPI